MYRDTEHYITPSISPREELVSERILKYRSLHQRFQLIAHAIEKAADRSHIVTQQHVERTRRCNEADELVTGDLVTNVHIANETARHIGASSIGNVIYVEQTFIPRHMLYAPEQVNSQTFVNVEAYSESSPGMPQLLQTMERTVTALEAAIQDPALPNDVINHEYTTLQPAATSQSAA